MLELTDYGAHSLTPLFIFKRVDTSSELAVRSLVKALESGAMLEVEH